ncbi:MAG: hypothetical protein ISR44_06455 [Rhodospirillales bacterium]|nr:hypothetical protein [Rhodospirillales bacterium]
MADNKPESEDGEEEQNVRRYCTLSLKTLERIRKLRRRETHGTSVPKIMTSMIEAGVRQAHKDGYLTDDDMF